MQTNLFIESAAEFSPDRVYRYSLWRFWSKNGGYAAFISLNPSTADEHEDDPTIRRCIRYAKDWGYSGLIMLNLFAYRSTNPKRLYTIDDPIGPDNNFHLRSASSKAQVTIHNRPAGIERALGDYTPGRFVWITKNSFAYVGILSNARFLSPLRGFRDF